MEIRDTAGAEPWHCQGLPQGTWHCRQGTNAAEIPRSVVDTQAPVPDDLPATSSTPAYRQLAYQPTAPTRLLDLPNHYFALQLAAFDSRAALDRFVRDNRLAGVVAVRAAREGKLEHVLLAGIYENRAIAERARDSLPKQLNSMRPWVRRLQSVQSAMRLADDLAGGNLAASVRIGEER